MLGRLLPVNTMLTLAAVIAISLLGCATAPTQKSQSSTEEFPLGNLTIDLPSFRTLDELRTRAKPLDGSEKFYLFPLRDPKVAVVISTWGSGDSWNAVTVYAHDELRRIWVPRALWNTESKGVNASFHERLGVIEVRSGRGAPILSMHISALRARRSTDW